MFFVVVVKSINQIHKTEQMYFYDEHQLVNHDTSRSSLPLDKLFRACYENKVNRVYAQ